MPNMFTRNRIESYEYELYTLQNGVYKTAGLINNVLSGSISLDFERDIITIGNLQLKDNNDIDFLKDIINPKYCLTYQGTVYKYSLGMFKMSSPVEDVNTITIREVTLHDLSLSVLQSKITESVTIPAGQVVTDVVKSILFDVSTWIKYNIQDSSETLLENMTYEVGKSRLFIVNSLLNTINYYPLFCTGNGVFISFPWEELPNISYEFLDNNEGIYKRNFKINLDYSNIYNRVTIIAKQLTEDAIPLISVKTFEDFGLDAHPLSYTSLGEYKDYKFDSEATSQTYLDLRAKREIYKMLEIEKNISYSHGFVSSRENDGLPRFGDAYRFRNLDKEIDEVFKIKSMSLELIPCNLVNSKINRISYEV